MNAGREGKKGNQQLCLESHEESHYLHPPPGSVHSLTGLVIANAIYFKGMWSMPFEKKGTETRWFCLLDGSQVRAPFMRARGDQAVAWHEGFKELQLPYRLPPWQDKYLRGRKGQAVSGDYAGGQVSDERPRFSMCVFLPDARGGLPDLVDKMASRLNFLWDHLPKNRVEADEVRLPKFKLSHSNEIDQCRSQGHGAGSCL
ncbi:Serpin-Z2B [Dichanthelium oligosanthes]|uniref:Serpin-Z2B n=1 Tax=Dichanthelium oligosanthes TaxID=888268 RepID=A0A1E5VEE4_9POAL|nr:Serpin-Z2B [Dichanthelium oligosanthes]